LFFSETQCSGAPTECEYFNFTDVHQVVNQRKLDNNVSVAKSCVVDVSTVDSDCGSGRHGARILTTQRVLPPNRCTITRVIICQTDDKVVWSISYKQYCIVLIFYSLWLTIISKWTVYVTYDLLIWEMR